MSKYQWRSNDGDQDIGEWEDIDATSWDEAIKIAGELLEQWAQSVREDECADEVFSGEVQELDDSGEEEQYDTISVTLDAEEPECKNDRPHKWGDENMNSIVDREHNCSAVCYERRCRRCGVLKRTITGPYHESVRYLTQEEQDEEQGTTW